MRNVSVIIPAYNKANFTVEAVESVLSQTYAHIEIIVVDDGSVDNTWRLLRVYHDKIKYIYKKNGGASSARNMGIQLATGEYIALLDCDDIYLPKKIEMSVDFLENNADAGFVYTTVYFIDEKRNILREYPKHKFLRSGNIAAPLMLRDFIPNSTVVIRRECFQAIGVFDESIFTPADWDMWLRLAENYKAGYIRKPLTMYRISESYILNNVQQAEREELVVLNKAFMRNKKNKPFFRNKALSNVYLRAAINYLLQKDFYFAKQKFLSAIKEDWYNARALLLFVYFIIAKRFLAITLKEMIFYKRVNIFPLAGGLKNISE